MIQHILKVSIVLLVWLFGNLAVAYSLPQDESRGPLPYSVVYIESSLEQKAQLWEALLKENLPGFHLFSHGRPGELFIEGEWKNPVEIVDWLNNQEIWEGKSALYLYGCEFAKGEKGRKAVEFLENSLHISVAASNDLTGKDGDWDLEIGNLSGSLSFLSYPFTLQDTDGDGVNDSSDLDSDNDGISDNLEKYGTNSPVSSIYVNEQFELSIIENLDGTPTVTSRGTLTNTYGDIGIGPDGTLYGIDFSYGTTITLYEIDESNANETSFGTISSVLGLQTSDILPNALAFDSRGMGYFGSGDLNTVTNPYFWIFDPNNLAAGASIWLDFSGLSGTLGSSNLSSSGDILFVSPTLAYASIRDWSNSNDYLVEVSINASGNPTSQTVLGQLPSNSFGLAADAEGKVYCIGDDPTNFNNSSLFEVTVPSSPVGGGTGALTVSVLANTGITFSGGIYGATGNYEALLGGIDTDGDNIADFLDLDSDGDGISDILEAGGTDSDGDGEVDYGTAGDPSTMTDVDGDGLADAVDYIDSGSGGGEVTSGTAWTNPDTDSDGLNNVVDIDSDNDGITDNVEAQSTSGYTAPSGSDTDGDGIDNAYDGDDNTTTGIGGGTGTAISPTNTDSDATADYLDSDSDDDGVNDVVEGHDTNGDGTVDGSDSPNANTGLAGGSTDADSDGLLDGFDNNTSSWDATNGSLTAESHPDVQPGTSEQDWREGPDWDGDGVADADDLDNDNDGIPDIEELPSGSLMYEFYDGTPSGLTVDNIPTSGALATGTVSDFDVNTLQNAVDPGDTDSYGIRYTGYIYISTPGLHTFETSSDDGSKVFLNGVEVVDNDGDHGVQSRSGTVTLSVGLHEVTILFYENGGGSSLSVSHQPPSGSLTALSFSNLYIDSDPDGDGISNHLDLDSDDDGIPDIIEAGGTDSDGDGQVLYDTAGDPSTLVDLDNDGLSDAVDDQDSGSGGGEVTNGTPWTNPDTDSDGLNNVVDIDSDNDGITDNVEAQSTSGYTAPSGSDTDGDGIDNAYDGDDNTTAGIGGGTGTATSPIDTESDGTSDYLDSDSDNDGVNDVVEGHDTNGDGTVDGSDSPNANTGLAGGTTDTDLDGLLDGFDNNTSSFDPTNGSLTAESHPDVLGGSTEQDWRENNDFDRDGIVDSNDLDDDNDGIPDTVEGCSEPVNSGTQNTSFPTGYWSVQYYEGVEAISGSSYGAKNGSGGAGTKVFRGTSYLGQDQDTVTYSSNGSEPDGRWSQLETPTDPLSPDNYVGTTWASSGNPHYQLEFRRKVLTSGNLTFGYGVNEVLDDAIEVFVNGSREYAYWPPGGGTAPDPPPGGGTGASIALIAGDEVEIRFQNIGWIGGLSFEFALADEPPSLNPDTDGDGISDCQDLDSDGDGIADIIEAEGTDGDGDGQVDYGTSGDPSTMTDADGDGLADAVDDQDSGSGGGEVTSGTAWTNPDTDSDGLNNVVDIDSDNDGITDNVEAQTTSGYTAPSGSDTDGDGIDNAYDGDDNITTGIGGGTGTALSPTDTDSDATADYRDSDSDNDGVNDVVEGHDTNGDGTVDGSDSPNANTGLAGGATDADADGLLDGFDNNTSSWDATNGSLTAESHPDVQAGTTEQDWREGTDSDRDGIVDVSDLDDDNDGIPDLSESIPCDGSQTYRGYAAKLYDGISGQDSWSILSGSSSFTTSGFTYMASFNYLEFDNTANGLNISFAENPYAFHTSADGDVSNFSGDTIPANGTDEDAMVEFYRTIENVEAGRYNINLDYGDDHIFIYINGSKQFQSQNAYGTYPKDATYTTVLSSVTLNEGDLLQIVVVEEFLFNTEVILELEKVANLDGSTPALCPGDSDQDGIPNFLDLDSDDDGIADIIEAGGTDSDGDGQVDYGTSGDPSTMTDVDEDGLADGVDNLDSGSGEDVTSGTALTDADSDSDGLENRIDIDSDADGITDNNEAQTSSGYTAPTGSDTDGDGIDNAYDGDDNTTTGIGGGTGTAISPTNTDEEADLPDYLDTDSDEDGESDTIEAYDTDDDGVADTTPAGSDADRDGLDDNFDSNDLASAASTNPNDNGETPGGFRDTDIVGGEPNWREPTAGGAPAPIELLSFSVYSLSNGTVKIRWQTLTETNNDFFTIERSRDAEYWEELAYVKGAGNSQETLNYQEIDRQPFLETSYYRLKQTDYNGEFSYSQIMDIYMDPGRVMPLEVYPIPTRGPLSIEGAPDELTSFTFFDVTGKDVTGQVRLIERTEFLIRVDISKLPRGVYLLKTENETVKVEKE